MAMVLRAGERQYNRGALQLSVHVSQWLRPLRTVSPQVRARIIALPPLASIPQPGTLEVLSSPASVLASS